MFIVSQAQIAQLDNLYLDRLIREIKTHVQAFFPQEYDQLNSAESDSLWPEAIQKANSFGLQTDRNITIFVDFLMTYGRTFPENHGWGKRILTDDSLLEDQKIEALLAALDD